MKEHVGFYSEISITVYQRYIKVHYEPSAIRKVWAYQGHGLRNLASVDGVKSEYAVEKRLVGIDVECHRIC